MPKIPKATIFVTTFNRQKMLERALTSIQNQSWKDFSVLVLDNGSTPPAILPKPFNEDPRFEIKRINDNAERSWFFYQETKNVKSEYFAILFDDDAWEEEKLQKQIEILEKERNIVGCFTHAKIINSQGELFTSPPSPYPMIFQQPNRTQAEWILIFFTRNNCLCQPSSLIRTNIMKAIVAPSPYCQLYDFMLWVKLIAHGNIHIIDEPLTRFHVSETGENASHLTPETINRLNYEYSQILHLFLDTPVDLLKEAFYCKNGTEADLEKAIFETAALVGSSAHIRFATEYAEARFIENFKNGNTQAAAYWQAAYIKISSGTYHLTQPPPTNARDFLESGIAAYQAGDLARATEAMSASLSQEEDPLAYTYLSLICAAQGLFEEAAAFIDQAQKLSPHRIDFVAALGEAFLKAGHPEEAVRYLQLAVEKQPDLFAAYPALARSLYLIGQDETALALLKSAATIPSEAQANIQTTLLEILAEQGDISNFADTCLRYSRGISDDLLAARAFARFDSSGEQLVKALSAAQTRLSGLSQPKLPQVITTTPLKIAFMVSDFAREQLQGRLLPLLLHLPPADFTTAVLFNDPCAGENEYAQTCSLVADQNLNIYGENDTTVQSKITALAPNILIDLDSYGPTDRLTILASASVPFKLTWGEAPMPPLIPGCQPLVGELVADNTMLPGVLLPGLGECLTLPELPISRSKAPTIHGTRFGCLTPAIRIGPESWRLFVDILLACPRSTLTLNLKDLGASARTAISLRFSSSGIDVSRLHFIHAYTTVELCNYWNELDIGLAPLVDAGELALPTCLWMGRPFVALATDLPWSHRPLALLKLAGAEAWIASSPSRYIELATQYPPAPNSNLRTPLQAFSDPVDFARGFAASITTMLNV